MLETNLHLSLGDSVTFAKTNNEYVDIIQAKATYDHKLYQAYIPVCVHPIKLEKLALNNITDFSLIQSEVGKAVNVSAYYSNGSVIDVTPSCTISSSFARWSFSNGSFTVTGDIEEIGTLEASYSDPDFPDLEKASLTKYMKLIPVFQDDIIALSSNIISSIDYNNLNSSETYNYTILGERKSGLLTDVTASSTISALNDNGAMAFNNGVMTVDVDKLNAGQIITLVATCQGTNAQQIKGVAIAGDPLTDLLVSISGSTSMLETFENEANIPFSVSALIGDDQVKALNRSDYEFECISTDKITISNDKISIGNFDENEFVTFFVSYEYHGKKIQKYVPILVKAIKITDLTIVGDLNVNESTTKQYTIKADKNNGITNVDVTETSTMRLAFGNPTNVTITNRKSNISHIQCNKFDKS